MRVRMKAAAATALAAVFLLGGALANADGGFNRKYEVTITNLTPGQTFTPQLVATHSAKVGLFELGQPASEALEILAEGGDTAPLTDVLLASPYEVADVQTIPGLLGPGQSVTVVVESTRFQRYLSLAAMLIPTNDSFVGLNDFVLPSTSNATFAPAYDAGTEENDELCANIPGPRCGGEGVSIADGEGFIYISQGMQGVGDLPAERYDWRNPVAYITVRRIPSP